MGKWKRKIRSIRSFQSMTNALHGKHACAKANQITTTTSTSTELFYELQLIQIQNLN